MEVSQCTELEVRLLKFPISSVYITFLVNGQDYQYGIVAVIEGTLEFIEYIELFQSSTEEICLIKRPTLVRAITYEPVKVFVLQFSEQFARENLYDLHARTITKLFSDDINKVIADINSFKVIKKLFLLLYKHINSIASSNSPVICQLTFNLLLSCISELKEVPVPKLQSAANYKVMTAMKFLRMVDEFAIKEHGVKFYASKLHMTQGNLTRIIKEVTAFTPKSIIEDSIVQKAKQILDNDLLNIYSIADEIGFKSSSAFINFFRFHTGRTPNEYRNRKVR